MSLDRLIEKIAQTKNPTVAGLDPKLDYIPEYLKEKSFEEYGYNLKGAADALFRFNKKLIDELYDIVPAVKPQAAYYEMYGYQGVKALYRTIAYALSRFWISVRNATAASLYSAKPRIHPPANCRTD